MKAIIFMCDSLNRQFLPPYGNDWVQAPNFSRLAERTVQFNRSWVGSMPCMPARREFHTGRYNFLHRSWGPLEPFDASMPKILSDAGIHTHLTTDHWHYWQEGGCTYHTKYDTCELVRGHCTDGWQACVGEPGDLRGEGRIGRSPKQFLVNQQAMQEETQTTTARVVQNGLDFLERNHAEDHWFLQIECFAPHEPFVAPESYRKLYDLGDDYFEWPKYGRWREMPGDHRELLRRQYAANLTLVDTWLGNTLDAMDRFGLWEDTIFILWTDHGFYLGEDSWYGKLQMPWDPELANTPFFVWDPRSARRGVLSDALVQPGIDLPVTLLEYFEQDVPATMQGRDLAAALAGEAVESRHILFGHHGQMVNCTDGVAIWQQAPASRENTPLFEYTLIPQAQHGPFPAENLARAELVDGFSFTNGLPLLRVPGHEPYVIKECQESWTSHCVQVDGSNPLPPDGPVARRLQREMLRLMAENEAPDEQYRRLGLHAPVK